MTIAEDFRSMFQCNPSVNSRVKITLKYSLIFYRVLEDYEIATEGSNQP